MSISDTYFDGTLRNDLFRLVCGEMLGYGVARQVYRCILDPSVVIKFESRSQSFQNILEWDVWQAIQRTDLAKWFAPCVQIGAAGAVLIMKKTEPIRVEELPKRIPNFLTDLKPANWGIYEGRPVVHDYGLHLLKEKGMTKRMVKVDWEYWR